MIAFKESCARSRLWVVLVALLGACEVEVQPGRDATVKESGRGDAEADAHAGERADAASR